MGILHKLLGGADWRKETIGSYEKRTEDRILEYLGSRSVTRGKIIDDFTAEGVKYSTTYNTLNRMLLARTLQESADGKTLFAVEPLRLPRRQAAARLGLLGTTLGSMVFGILTQDTPLVMVGLIITLAVAGLLTVS